MSEPPNQPVPDPRRLGRGRPERARQAATLLSARGNNGDGDPKGELLADIRSIFAARGVDRLRTKDLIAALHGLDARPWLDWKGRGIQASEVAALLRPFDIGPGTVRFGAKTAKGYKVDDFQDAFARYPRGTSADTAGQP